MKFDSLAMIETNGLVSALMAVNKMTSSSNVEYLKKKIISNGQVIVFIIGNSFEIKKVLDDGIIAAQKVGIVISSGILPYPNEIIEKIISETSNADVTPKKVLKSIKKVKEKIEILFDQKEDEKSYIELIARVAENRPDIAGDILSIKHHDHDILEEDTFDTISSADHENEEEMAIINSKQTAARITELLKEEKILTESEKEILDDHGYNIDEKNDEFEGMSHLERLRAEAKSEIQTERENPKNINELEEIKPEVNKVIDDNLASNENSEVKTESEVILESKLSKMNVPDLRKLARSIENFPIKGREISKANKKALIKHFKQL